MATSWRSRVVDASLSARMSRRSPCGANNAAPTRISGSSLVCDASTIAVIAASSPVTRRRSSWCMLGTIAGGADTSLTRPTVALMLEFLVLGPVEVRRDGKRVAIPGGKTAELLVHLALAAGGPVRADRLLDDLWAGTPTNRNTLQQKVARLRRGLGDPSLLAGGDDGYRLAIEPAAVDAHRVLRDLHSATALLGDGDHAPAAAASATALALFHGDVLPSAGDWAAPQRAQLEEARMQLMETRFAAQ